MKQNGLYAWEIGYVRDGKKDAHLLKPELIEV